MVIGAYINDFSMFLNIFKQFITAEVGNNFIKKLVRCFLHSDPSIGVV